MVVAVPKMRERDRVGLPTCLPAQLLEHKGFQQLAKQRAILVQRGRVQPQQRRCHACVGQMHLRCLDQSAWLAQVPRRQLFQQKDAFRQRDVVPDDGPADLEGPARSLTLNRRAVWAAANSSSRGKACRAPMRAMSMPRRSCFDNLKPAPNS